MRLVDKEMAKVAKLTHRSKALPRMRRSVSRSLEDHHAKVSPTILILASQKIY